MLFHVFSPTPTLIILEPHLSSRTEIPIALPTTTLASGGLNRKNQRYLKVVRGLEWILAPGYAEKEERRTVVEIVMENDEEGNIGKLCPCFGLSTTGANDQAFVKDGHLPSNGRYLISSGDHVIASFERREEDRASGKPWLDRVASRHAWVPL